MKGSRRAGTRTVVVHARDNAGTDKEAEIAATGPRFGLIVSKPSGMQWFATAPPGGFAMCV